MGTEGPTEPLQAAHEGPVLLCFDGSPDATEAIERAGAIVADGTALVVYAWLPPSALLLQGRLIDDPHPLAPAAAEFDATAAADAERIAAEGARLASLAGFDATSVAQPAALSIWRAIVEVADEHDARLIVVGSHGRSAVQSMLLGSVSRAIVNHSSRPVLVAPCSGNHPGTSPG